MNKIFIISEIGINHNGDLNLAKKMIEQSVQAGANDVKFQKEDCFKSYSSNIDVETILKNQNKND